MEGGRDKAEPHACEQPRSEGRADIVAAAAAGSGARAKKQPTSKNALYAQGCQGAGATLELTRSTCGLAAAVERRRANTDHRHNAIQHDTLTAQEYQPSLTYAFLTRG